MDHRKITLICADEASDLATIASRGVLEYFNYVVTTHWIGNKKDFLDLLRHPESVEDIVLISAHGTDGKFSMPNNESVSFEELDVRLSGKTVISTGCETHGAAEQFIKGGCAAYIAPAGSPEGNDAMFFTTKFFWLLAQGKTPKQAFEISLQEMPKGSEFMMREKSL